MSKFTVLNILLLSLILSTLGCKKETIEIEKKVFIYSTTDSTIIKDTIIGRPYQWVESTIIKLKSWLTLVESVVNAMMLY